MKKIYEFIGTEIEVDGKVYRIFSADVEEKAIKLNLEEKVTENQKRNMFFQK